MSSGLYLVTGTGAINSAYTYLGRKWPTLFAGIGTWLMLLSD